MKKLILVVWLLSANVYAEEWAVDSKKLTNSYGVFIGYMAGVFTAIEECRKVEKEISGKNMSIDLTLNNWKQRHSYADKFRNDFDRRFKLQHGEVAHEKLIIGAKKLIEDLQNDVQSSISKSGLTQSCSNLLISMNDKNKDFINTKNVQFIDIANALTKK